MSTRVSTPLALLLIATLLAGCSGGSSSAVGRTQQDPSYKPQEQAPEQAPPAPSEMQAAPDRPLPHAPDPVPGYAAAIEAGTRTADGRPGDAYWQQSATYDLAARVFPDSNRLEGVARITYTNNSPDALETIHVELSQNLHAPGVVRNVVSEVTGGVQLEQVVLGQSVIDEGTTDTDSAHYRVENTQLVLVPTNPVPAGATVSFRIDYRFTIPQAGASGRMGYSDDLLFLAYWYPQVSVYDDVVGWMDDPFQGRAEFYADFADYTLSIEAPEGWVVQSTGALQNAEAVLAPDVLARRADAYASDTPVMILEPGQMPTVDAANDRVTWEYTAERVRDVAFSLTKDGYWEGARTSAGDRDGDGVADSTRINSFWRESAPKWAEMTRYQQHAISFFAEYMDMPYPWPHMSAVEGGGIIGGGMEFPMMTIMGDYNTRSARMLYAVTAHELAHMWVPMIVNTNERRYSWMDEGTTSFNENMAREDFFETSEAVESDRQDYINVALREGEGEMMRRSAFHYDPTAFVVASYRKPATLYVALRGVLGEETFNRAYRTFLQEWAYKHPYPTDFFNTMERVSGRDLDWFWSTWYYTTWTMDQAIGEVAARDGSVEVQIEDLGRAPMPVHLTTTLTTGETVTQTIPVRVWLQGRTSARTLVNVSMTEVERIEIDAARDFPDVDRSNNVWTAGE